MLRSVNSLLRCRYFKPRIMNIDNLIKKANLKQQQQIKSTLPSPQKSSIKTNQNQEQISLTSLRKVIQHQKLDLTREQQTINYQIKIQTKVNNLYNLLKHKSLTFTDKNMVNLLVKVLELRQINTHEAEQTTKFHKLIQRINKKARKMAPEEMIRLLYSMKKVKMLNADIKRMSILIKTILQEFSSREQSKQKEFQSFQVISVDSNIKLLHSLDHLYSISGGQYEPVILQLIRHSLLHFYKLSCSKEGQFVINSTIKWYFYFGFIQLSCKYNLAIEVVRAFVRVVNSLKNYYISRYNLLFSLQSTIHTMQVIKWNCRGNQISQFRQFFHFHLYVFQSIQKPNQIIKIRPIFLLQHIDHLNNFTTHQIKTLQFENLREITFHRILVFTTRIYQKLFTKHYLNLVQKSNIEKWAQDAGQNNQQFLGSVLTIYGRLIAEKKANCINQYNKLLSLCLQFFQSLSFNTQATLVRIGIVCSFKNIKIILDSFFRVLSQTNKPPSSYLKKHQEVISYIELFTHWNHIQQTIKLQSNTHFQSSFFKIFFIKIIHLPHLEKIASLFSQRVLVDRPFLSLLIKKYIRYSDQNRILGTKFLNTVQTSEFKSDMLALDQLIDNELQDKDKLSPFVRLKYRLREKMKRCLTMFKFFLLLFQNINKTLGSPAVDVTCCTLFKEIYFHFNEEMKCLNYKELATGQIYDFVSEICQYLSRTKLQVQKQHSVVFAMYERHKCQRRRSNNLDYQKNLYLKYAQKVQVQVQRHSGGSGQTTAGQQTERLAYLNIEKGFGIIIDESTDANQYTRLDQLIHRGKDGYLTIIHKNINQL